MLGLLHRRFAKPKSIPDSVALEPGSIRLSGARVRLFPYEPCGAVECWGQLGLSGPVAEFDSECTFTFDRYDPRRLRKSGTFRCTIPREQLDRVRGYVRMSAAIHCPERNGRTAYAYLLRWRSVEQVPVSDACAVEFELEMDDSIPPGLLVTIEEGRPVRVDRPRQATP